MLLKARPRVLVIAAAVASVLAFPAVSRADTTIDTTPAWNGSTSESSFGDPDTETYGQTITVPASDPTLQSFTFYMKLPTALVFRGEVYAWDGSKATGEALYESGPTHTTNASVFQPITFNTGTLRLKPGGQYVLFASVARDGGADSGTNNRGSWGRVAGTAYSGGNMVFQNAGGSPYDPTIWTSTAWDGNITTSDMAFKASFTSVTAGKVLVLGTTVSSTPSVEEAQARAQGFDVDVVDGPTWDAMSPAQFAAYRALIIGDDRCHSGTTPLAPAVSNASTWASAVTGPVIATGADAEDHAIFNADPVPPRDFMRQGIGFAAQVPGRTGAYVGIACYPTGTEAAHVLDGFGSFTVTHMSQNTIHSDPAVFGPSALSDSELSGWGQSTHSYFNTFASPFKVWSVAVNPSGTYTTSDAVKGFPVNITRAGFPSVVTGGASGVSTSGATLTGTVAGNGSPASYIFQYGTSTMYGASTAPAAGGAGVLPSLAAANIGSLPPGTPIHYRIAALNGVGAAYGADQVFTTAALPAAPAFGTLSFKSNPKLTSDGVGAVFTGACAVVACNVNAVMTVVEKVQGNNVLSVAARKKKIKKRTVVVGSVTVSISPGGSKTITVRLNKTGRKLLKKFGKLPVTLTVNLVGPNGQKIKIKTKRLVLKPHKKKKKKH